MQTDVVRNGTYFDRRRLPFIGYQPVFELSIDEVRKHFGLAPRPPMPGPNDVEARQSDGLLRNEDRVHIDAIIGTAADQIAVTPGVLRRSWTENGRRYFQYESEGPIVVRRADLLRPVRRARGPVDQDVDTPDLPSPGPRQRLDSMIRGMKASLEYYTRSSARTRFASSASSRFRRTRSSATRTRARSPSRRTRFFSRVKEGEIDQPFYGTAHEIAHQWQVSGAVVRGTGFLSESLANYSAMMVTEKTFGLEAARRVYDFQMERYLGGRAEQSREVPVLEVEKQPYIMYRKGAIALLTLRDLIGEETVNAALRRYLEKYRNAGPPYPTSLDQYAELRAVTPDSLQYLLEDLFETVTLWDVRTERASVEPTGTGEYQVTLDVVAKKMRADSVGSGDRSADGRPRRDRRLRARHRRRPRRAALPAAAPHPERQADDPHHRSARAGPRRHRSLPQADRPRAGGQCDRCGTRSGGRARRPSVIRRRRAPCRERDIAAIFD